MNILLGWLPLLEAIAYLLVGLAGLYELEWTSFDRRHTVEGDGENAPSIQQGIEIVSVV